MALTHLGAKGEANMVDVGDKAETTRTAIAEGFVSMQPETLEMILAGDAKKGDVLGTARIAGIMAAKKTHELIPLCHPLLLTKVAVEIESLCRSYLAALAVAEPALLSATQMAEVIEKFRTYGQPATSPAPAP